MPTELHLALQEHYAGTKGATEAPVGPYRADVLRDGVCYEIQTGSFGAIRPKLQKLLDGHAVVLVHPIPLQKIIVQLDGKGHEVSARRSPKRGRLTDVFTHLLHLRGLLSHPNLQLEIVLTVERELRRKDGFGSRHRKGASLLGRELVEVVSVERFAQPADLLRLLPEGLPREFTVKDLQAALGARGGLSGRMAYALRELGVLEHVGKRGNAFVYRRARRRRKGRVPSA